MHVYSLVKSFRDDLTSFTDSVKVKKKKKIVLSLEATFTNLVFFNRFTTSNSWLLTSAQVIKRLKSSLLSTIMTSRAMGMLEWWVRKGLLQNCSPSCEIQVMDCPQQHRHFPNRTRHNLRKTTSKWKRKVVKIMFLNLDFRKALSQDISWFTHCYLQATSVDSFSKTNTPHF